MNWYIVAPAGGASMYLEVQVLTGVVFFGLLFAGVVYAGVTAYDNAHPKYFKDFAALDSSEV